MAKTYSKLKSTTNKAPTPQPTTRAYTVGYLAGQPNTSTPTIHLKGKWLNAAGFTTGSAVIVRVMPGCLVITTEQEHIIKQQQLLDQIQQAEKRIAHLADELTVK